MTLRRQVDLSFRVLIAAIGLAISCSGTATARAPSVWELTPYRVRIVTAFTADPQFTTRLRADVTNGLTQSAEATLGAAWHVTINDAALTLRREILTHLESLQIGDLPEELLEAEAETDKVMFLGIDVGPSGWRVAARDLDLRTRQLGLPISRVVVQREQLADEAFRAVRAAFVPLAKIDNVADTTVDLRMRAAGLVPPDRATIVPAVGDIFRPVLRLSDRYGRLRRTDALEWTYLVVGVSDEERVITHLHTGLRSPLGRAGGARVESLAIAQRVPERTTRLELVSRTKRDRRLPGYEIHSYHPPGKATTLLGRTDQQGTIAVPAEPRGLNMLLVKHGGELLARLPVVPGLVETLRAEIPDDDLRLEAEGFITGMQENLVDWVARRQLLAARIRARLEDGAADEAQKLFVELRQLGTPEQFAQSIRIQRRKSSAEDPRVQAKIDKLFNDTQEAVKRFSNESEIAQLESQLAAARKPK